MTPYYHHNIIRKYTLGLLDSFNNVQVERTLNDGSISYIQVPITFGSRDKAFTITEMDMKQWLTNNYNVLPRMALSTISMNKDLKRDTHKLHTINQTVDGTTLTFQYNAVAWNFSYELAIAARSMTELSMIIEQIVPHFNPTYNLRIYELDIQDTPTTVPVILSSLNFEIPNNMGQEEDIRIVGAVITLELKGNIYQPFMTTEAIDNVRLYLNNWVSTDPTSDSRSVKYEFDVDPNTKKLVPGSAFTTDMISVGAVGQESPGNWFMIAQDGTAILNQDGIPVLSPNTLFITGPTNIPMSSTASFTLNFIDTDSETGFIYLWNVLSGNATIVQNNVNPVTIQSSASAGVILLQAQVVDKDGIASAYTTKNIIVG